MTNAQTLVTAGLLAELLDSLTAVAQVVSTSGTAEAAKREASPGGSQKRVTEESLLGYETVQGDGARSVLNVSRNSVTGLVA